MAKKLTILLFFFNILMDQFPTKVNIFLNVRKFDNNRTENGKKEKDNVR